MGAGKSSVGRRLASRIGFDFVDADTEIEAAAGASIPEIFAEPGEAVFRDGERQVIARLLDRPGIVLATGGGAFMNVDTRAHIRDRALSLRTTAVLHVRISLCHRPSPPPLLHNGLLRGPTPRQLTPTKPPQ